jgi:hypothetical protein
MRQTYRRTASVRCIHMTCELWRRAVDHRKAGGAADGVAKAT